MQQLKIEASFSIYNIFLFLSFGFCTESDSERFCDDVVFRYTIMKMCWNLEADERPTFSKISQLIERMLGDTEDQQVHHSSIKPHTSKIQKATLLLCNK